MLRPADSGLASHIRLSAFARDVTLNPPADSAGGRALNQLRSRRSTRRLLRTSVELIGAHGSARRTWIAVGLHAGRDHGLVTRRFGS